MDTGITQPHVKITWRVGLEIAAGIVAVVVFWSWLSARDANVKAAAIQAANEKVISQNDAQMKQNAAQVQLLKDQITQLQTDYVRLQADQARQLAAVQATFSRSQTPAQAASLTDILLALKAGETKVGGTAAAPTLEVPKAELQAYQQACEECKVKVPNLTAQLANKDSQLANAGSQLAKAQQDNQLLASNLVERTQERDGWKTAAKGGSFWQRLGRSMKYIGIGGGIAAGLICGSGHCK